MAVIVNGDGILTGVSSLTTALDDLTSGRGTITGVTTVGTLQLGTGVSISSPRTQQAAIFTNNTEFFTVDDAGRVGIAITNPTTKFDVNGTSKFQDDVTFTGASYNVVWDKSDDQLEFGDNAKLSFGTSSDLQIFHDGNNSFINEVGTGGLFVRAQNTFNLQKAGTSEFMLKATTDGAVELYHDNSKKIETTSSGCRLEDSVRLSLGTSDDLQLDHDGTDNRLLNQNNKDFKLYSNGDIALSISGTTGDISIPGSSDRDLLWDKSDGCLEFADNAKAKFGNGADLNIFHNGTNSFISNTTGILQIDSDDRVQVNATEFRVKNAGDTELIAKFIQDGAVELYHNNSLRLSTEASQVTLHRPSGFPNPNNTGSEITGATLDFGGNLHLEERYPNGAYVDRQDLVLRTNTGYGQGLADKVRFSSSGSIFLEVAGSGISFEPHGASSVNLLNDYEVGTFTPTAAEGGSVSSYAIQRASYTKIGDFVHCQIDLSVNGTASGDAFRIGGLPFTSANQATYAFGGAFLAYSNGAFPGGSNNRALFHVFSGGTLIGAYQEGGSPLAGNSTGMNVYGNKEFLLVVAYKSV